VNQTKPILIGCGQPGNDSCRTEYFLALLCRSFADLCQANVAHAKFLQWLNMPDVLRLGTSSDVLKGVEFAGRSAFPANYLILLAGEAHSRRDRWARYPKSSVSMSAESSSCTRPDSPRVPIPPIQKRVSTNPNRPCPPSRNSDDLIFEPG
jgi:hypothetical protein